MGSDIPRTIILRHLTLIGLVCLAAADMSRGEIHVGGNASGVVTVDLESFSGLAGRPGTAHALLRNAELGVSFGEKLVGQVEMPVGNFDDIGGTPSVPLAIDSSVVPEFGVNVLTVSGSTITLTRPLGSPALSSRRIMPFSAVPLPM